MALSAKRFQKYQELLEYISIAARPQLKALCHYLHSDLVKLITDIAYNLLYNRSLPLEAEQRVSLRKHKHILRQLAIGPGSVEQKRKLLRKKGHILLPELVKPVLDKLVYGDDQQRTNSISKSNASTD